MAARSSHGRALVADPMHTIVVRSASKSTEIIVGFVCSEPATIVLKAPAATATLCKQHLGMGKHCNLLRLIPSDSHHDVCCSCLLDTQRLSREMYKKRAVNDGALLPQCWTWSRASKLGSHDSPRWGLTQGQVQSVVRTNRAIR